MIKEFCKVAKNDDFITEIDISKPKNIHSMMVTSISSSTDNHKANFVASR